MFGCVDASYTAVLHVLGLCRHVENLCMVRFVFFDNADAFASAMREAFCMVVVYVGVSLLTRTPVRKTFCMSGLTLLLVSKDVFRLHMFKRYILRGFLYRWFLKAVCRLS